MSFSEQTNNMGKIFSSVFGGSGSKSKQQSTASSSSQNQAYPWLQETYSPQVQTGLDATGALKNLLGLSGPAQFDDQFNDYKDSSGYNFMFDQGQKAITGNNAVKGLLNSGSTLKALNAFGTNTASTYFNQYLDRLLGLSKSGQEAGGLISGAGNTSQSQSQSTGKSSSYQKPGIASFLGSAISGLPMG
jgi:hypothetical protein